MKKIKLILFKLYQHFDTTPPGIELINYRFYIVSNIGQTIAWSTHLVWMFMFFQLQVLPMAYLQIVSVLLYIIAIVFNRKGFHVISMSISMIEIVAHQIIAVRFLGWQSSFQYFIPVVAIFPFLIPKGLHWWKWIMFLTCVAGFIFIEFFIRNTMPYYQLNESAIMFFHVANILLSFVCFLMWAIFLTQAVNRSQTIIEDTTKELIKAEEAIKHAEIQMKLELSEREKQQKEELLLNVLPKEVAMELIEKGKSVAKVFSDVTVMFTDFKDFTRISEKMNPEELVKEIDDCFSAFDKIIENYNIEKIKTIGDSYMCAGGLPVANTTHAVDVVNAAIEIRDFMDKHNSEIRSTKSEMFQVRIGIHTGPVVAGIVGIKKFSYDIWGDTVNTASRMESSGEAGKINISGSTYELVKDKFACVHRGKIQAKNKGEVDMYFVVD